MEQTFFQEEIIPGMSILLGFQKPCLHHVIDERFFFYEFITLPELRDLVIDVAAQQSELLKFQFRDRLDFALCVAFLKMLFQVILKGEETLATCIRTFEKCL